MGDRIGIAFGLEGIALVASDMGAWEPTTRLYSASAALRDDIGAPLPPDNRDVFARATTEARDALGDPRFAVAWSAGQALALDDAVAEALAFSRAWIRGPSPSVP